MASAHLVPIVIGVGDVVNRSLAIQDAVEPLQLMLQAIQNAIEDAGTPAIAKVRSSIDSIDVVRPWTWPYPDLPGLISKRLGIAPYHQCCSPHGGNQPAKLIDEAAQRISRGESSVTLVVGGEALASRMNADPILLVEVLIIISKCMCNSWSAPSTGMDRDKSECCFCCLSDNHRDETWCVY